jgi:hypothetical protein
MKGFLSSIAIAMVREKDEIRVLNMKIAGKRETQDEFNTYTIAYHFALSTYVFWHGR